MLRLFIYFGFLSSCATSTFDFDQHVTFNKKKFQTQDLKLSEQIEKYTLERKFYDDLKKLYDAAAISAHVKDVAAEQKITEAQARKLIFKSSQPTEADTKDYFEKNRDKIPYSYEFAKSELKNQMLEENEKNRQDQVLKKLEDQGTYAFAIDPPPAPRIAIDISRFPAIGQTKNPKLTIIQVFDYMCPFCKMEEPKLQSLVKKFSDKILLVVIDYTQIHGESSRKLALMGYCAKKFNVYPAFREKFIGFMQTDAILSKQASEVMHVTEAELKTCITSKNIKSDLNHSESLVQSWGLSQTPAFFLNNEYVGNQLNDSVIENYLSKD